MNDFIISLNSSKLDIKIIDENQLNLDEKKINYELTQLDEYSYLLKLDNKVCQLTVEKINGDLFRVLINGHQYEITVRTALQEKAYKLLEKAAISHSHHTDVKAPMPGLIIKLKKQAGENVEQGESVVILEAMKIENDLKAPSSGIIQKVFVTEGSAVEKGVLLFSIA